MKMVRNAVLVLATSAAVLLPAQAFADSTVHQDATGDMLQFNFSEQGETTTPAPDRTDGDIRGISATHALRKVLISVRFVEWTRNPDVALPLFRLRTNEHKIRDVMVLPGTRTRPSWASMSNARGREVRCRITTAVDIIENKVRLEIPRKCLSRPRWVQVGAGVVSVDDESFFVDDAYQDGRIGNQLALGPRLF